MVATSMVDSRPDEAMEAANGCVASEVKNKKRGKILKSRSSPSRQDNKADDNSAVEVSSSKKKRSTSNGVTGPDISRKMPKRAAACSNFREKSFQLCEKLSVIETKQVNCVEEEILAIRLTKCDAVDDDPQPNRKLVDFIFHDESGNPKPFEMSEVEDLYISAVILPWDSISDKDKEKGVRCEGFGRIEEWSISGYEDDSPVIWVSTRLSDYDCLKPATSYKKFFDYFYDKARTCVEVYRKLSVSSGGNPHSSLDELLAAVARSLTSRKAFRGGAPTKDYILSQGEFIYNQLIGLDQSTKANDQVFTGLPVLDSLRDGCRKRKDIDFFQPSVLGGKLIIGDGESDDQPKISDGAAMEVDEDAKLAQLLQEEEYRKSLKKKNSKNDQKFYIKINEDEIANDYPLPAYYKSSVEEMDEYMFFEDDGLMYPADLPRAVLHNWSLYNSDSRLVSLELLPIRPGAEVDIAIFGSGIMMLDDGSGFDGENKVQSSSRNPGGAETDGIPIYLSAIKEWVIEYGAEMVFISIRTDLAWYRLGKPSKQYVPWYDPVVKTAKLAVGIITLLKEQSRASKLSFMDVIKKVAEFTRDDPAYISSNSVAIERYVVVHGQIILQQFSEYPDKVIQTCAFVTGLSKKMEERHHTKLTMMKKLVVQREANLNPRALAGPLVPKRKPMRATTTKLINRIWGDYYSCHFPEDIINEENNEPKEEEVEEDQDENEDDETADPDNQLPEKISPSKQILYSSRRRSHSSEVEIEWSGISNGSTSSGLKLYKTAKVHGDSVSLGDAVLVEVGGCVEDGFIAFVEYMYEAENGDKMGHGRLLQKGSETVLENAAKDRELFLTNQCIEFDLDDMKQKVKVEIRRWPWGSRYRKENINADKIDCQRAEERAKKGLPTEFYCKSLYCPERGAFFTLPFKTIGLGSGICHSCDNVEVENDVICVDPSSCSFMYKNNKYSVNDFVYIAPYHITKLEETVKYKAGRNVGLKAYVVGHLLEIVASKNTKHVSPSSTNVKIRRFFRPEDVSSEKAYVSDIREVYYSEEILTLAVETLEGKCQVRRKQEIPPVNGPAVFDHTFYCEYAYDPSTGTINQLPASVLLRTFAGTAASAPSSRKSKGKSKMGEEIEPDFSIEKQETRLATLDIFAGCGGLSEGLNNAGVSVTKWAIEYENPAAEAFGCNHPDSLVFADNCNVILRAIMEKCGDLDDCVATSEAAELSAKFSKEKIENLPVPGQVDFINGGPPCQGFSGMNRFNQSTWSKVQCEMILAFLSFADYFRPRYFLLENVRNFVSFNKGQTFRLTVASLLEMGYQVRFGILEAGSYGVSQSRKRAFIWAAAPGDILPEWPEPMYVFSSPELRISLPGNVQYAAVKSTVNGAPFRSITVRDTIGDLPPVKNGASNLNIDYGQNAVSWFQKQTRGSMISLTDHISKEMNELNLIRCQKIPKRPGADWHDLPDEKVKLSTGQMVDLIPWCLPNTAKRHNQWKGLFGRLDWEGNFPTSITDPQPMGKVGMCFHPDQDRILTVRECARSQGFPDSYKFCGNIVSKHRQIGNAVPPPLALALGRKLKEAMDAACKPASEGSTVLESLQIVAN